MCRAGSNMTCGSGFQSIESQDFTRPLDMMLLQTETEGLRGKQATLQKIHSERNRAHVHILECTAYGTLARPSDIHADSTLLRCTYVHVDLHEGFLSYGTCTVQWQEFISLENYFV